MGRDELRATAMAGKATAAVSVELLDERPALAAGVSIIAKAGAAGVDCLIEHRHDRVAQELGLLEGDRRRRPRRIDPGAPERFVRVDVADACDFSLLHEDF